MKEELFDDLILERGYEYAQEGAVDHVRQVGDSIYATVHGTEDYHVKIDNNDMSCDCPYAKEGAHCKPMAAVMYYLDILWTLVKEDGQIDFYRELKRQYTKEEWTPLRDELLNNLPPRARLDKIYLEEGMYDELLDLVIHTPGLYVLEEYYHDLLDYPEQLLNKYLEELKPLVGKQDITHYLKEIEEIPGGIQFISSNHLRK